LHFPEFASLMQNRRAVLTTPRPAGSGVIQLAFSAVSSMKKLVCNDESSVPVHFSVTV
jgi:hypothetical protein